MSGHGPYPPPGQPSGPPPAQPSYPASPYAQPAYPPPDPRAGSTQAGYAQAGYPYAAYPRAGHPVATMAAHKPGAVPLRPLGLGDIYDAAFKIIRFNPKATVGSAVLVTAVAMAIPILVTGVLTLLLDLSLSTTTVDSDGLPTEDVAGYVASYSSMVGGSILQAFGLIFVTGMIAHVTAAAAVGNKLSLGAAWAATRGKRWRLVGLSALLGVATVVFIAVLVGVIFVLAVAVDTVIAVLASIALVITGVCALVFFWVRVYYLAVPPLMLEPIGVFGALGRSWALTSRQFWRTFGIALLTLVITQIVGGILGTPFSIAGFVGVLASGDSEAGLLIMVVSNALSAVVTAAFVAPFTASVASLQYVDQRIRKEGYDVELMTRAGIVSP